MVPKIWCVTDGATDGQTDRQTEIVIYIVVGAPPKNNRKNSNLWVLIVINSYTPLAT